MIMSIKQRKKNCTKDKIEPQHLHNEQAFNTFLNLLQAQPSVLVLTAQIPLDRNLFFHKENENTVLTVFAYLVSQADLKNWWNNLDKTSSTRAFYKI